MSAAQQIAEALRRLPLASFRPASLGLFKGYSRQDLGKDISAGLTVGVVALPLAMAFAIASGVTPEAGI
ncbi:MAG: SulP family inorganic anion transporter, partial [Burkholderiaceae bacterium]